VDGRKSLSEKTSDKPSDSACHFLVRDSDLARIIEAWPTLPEHLKAAVMALLTSAR